MGSGNYCLDWFWIFLSNISLPIKGHDGVSGNSNIRSALILMWRFQTLIFFLFASNSCEPLSNSRLLLCCIYAFVLLFTLYFLLFFFVKVKEGSCLNRKDSKQSPNNLLKKNKTNNFLTSDPPVRQWIHTFACCSYKTGTIFARCPHLRYAHKGENLRTLKFRCTSTI